MDTQLINAKLTEIEAATAAIKAEITGTPPTYKQARALRDVNVRPDHSANNVPTGQLKTGQTVTVYETWTSGADLWVRHGPGQWSAMVYSGIVFMEYL